MADLAIAVIHGMGSQTRDFAEPVIEELSRRVQKRGKDPARIAWQPIYWADLLDGAELAYFNRAKNRGSLDYLRLRRFVVTAFGDAVAYQPVASQHNTTYQDVHGRVREAIHELYVEGLGSRPKPLIVLAHSMGGHILSNYIWDAQKERRHRRAAVRAHELAFRDRDLWLQHSFVHLRLLAGRAHRVPALEATRRSQGEGEVAQLLRSRRHPGLSAEADQ